MYKSNNVVFLNKDDFTNQKIYYFEDLNDIEIIDHITHNLHKDFETFAKADMIIFTKNDNDPKNWLIIKNRYNFSNPVPNAILTKHVWRNDDTK